ncbi:MAG: hypothetical protein ACI396_00625 [Acutalibacteraceae bacterium]
MRYDNMAYDYNKMNSAAPRELPQTKTQIKTLPRQKKKAKASSSLVLKIAAAGIVLFMLSFNIYTRAEINDVQSEIDAAKSTIEELDSEKTMLQMEMENIISYSNLEQEAQRLGMQKKTKQQIHYFNSSEGDSAEIINKN